MNAFVVARYEIILKLLEDYGISEKALVLDVGSGDGALSGELIRKFQCRIEGVETEELAIEFARNKFDEKGYTGNFHKIEDYVYPFANSDFDFVVCADVIEHVPEPLAMLAEIKRVLKTGGFLAISTPLKTLEKPIDSYHYTEWFVSEFENLCTPLFGPPLEKIVSHPAFWSEFYRMSFYPGIINRAVRLSVNLMAKHGLNVFIPGKTSWNIFVHQTMLFRK